MTFRRPHITPAPPFRWATRDATQQSLNLPLITNNIPVWTVFDFTYKPLPSVPFNQQIWSSFYQIIYLNAASTSSSAGNGKISGAASFSSAGSARGWGRGGALWAFFVAARSLGAGFGKNGATPSALLLSLSSFGKGNGKATPSLSTALAGLGPVAARSVAGISVKTALAGKGVASAFAKVFAPGGIALIATSIAAARGRFGGMSGAVSLRGTSTAEAKSSASFLATFFATARSIAAGRGGTFAQAAAVTIALLARSFAGARGVASSTVKTSLSSVGIAGAVSRSGAIFKAVLATKTAASAKGAALVQALVSLSTRSSAIARGIAFDGADAALSAISRAVATGRSFTTGKLSLTAKGAARSFGVGFSAVQLVASSMAMAVGALWMFVPSGRIVKAFHLASARTVQVPLGGSGGSMLVWQTKDPNDILDYDIDWTLALSSGDSIVSSVWTMFQTDGALTIQTNPAPSYINTSTKLWLAGGTVGEGYILRNTITTAIGDKMEESVLILVRTK